MPRTATTTAVLLWIVAGSAWSQQANLPVRTLAWQSLGARTVDLNLAGPAGGPVADVFFSADGSSLFAITARGTAWISPDLGETWTRANGQAETLRQQGRPLEGAIPVTLPADDSPLSIYRHSYDSRYIFALGGHLYRSSDEGRSWVNLTGDGLGSIIGFGERAIAFYPLDSELIVVANSRGLWRSTDGGLSWTDLNHNLANLPEARLAKPASGSVPKVFLSGIGAVESGGAGVWQPAFDERAANWMRALDSLPEGERSLTSPWPLDLPSGWAVSYRVWRQGVPVSPDLTHCSPAGPGGCAQPERFYISAWGSGSDAQPNFYAGTSDGHLWVSSDGGRTWRAAAQGLVANSNPVTRIFVDPKDSRIALAVLGGRGSGHVFRTTNAGLFWDDLSSDLPDAPVLSVAANPETGSIYAASALGVFHTRTDLRNPAPAGPWSRLGGNLPEGPIEDLELDGVSGALYAVVAGHGVFRTNSPDLMDTVRVLNAADLTARAAAPGGLLTVMGASVRGAQANSLTAPVLASSGRESQIQVPFEATGTTLNLALETQLGPARIGLPLEAVSPAIFLDSDGTPLVLDAGAGVLLDGGHLARAGSQILILATGLGRVRPDWPTGLAAPLDDPPVTVAPVAAFLNGAPLRVLSSTLAGGYIGVYMVRVELPAVLNAGTAELHVASGDKTSNRVRIFLEP